jgi:hypothetical protein
MLIWSPDWGILLVLVFSSNQIQLFIICHYSPTRFRRFCDRQHGVTQESKQYSTLAQNA